MTREEAIHCLSVHSSTNGSGLCTDEQHYEAKQMAIQALEQEPCDVFDKYGNYKYPSDVELTEPNTATSMPCEDAIGRQAAIEIARSNIHYGLDKEYEYARELLQKTMAEINSLPPVNPQPKTEWIPVSKRLPEKNMRCLVAVGRFNFTQIVTYSDLMGTIDHKIFYQGDYGHRNFEDITQYVKAWMPLPEPYRAESEDKE